MPRAGHEDRPVLETPHHDSACDGLLAYRQIVSNDPGYLVAKADAVIGSAIFRIDLAGVGEIKTLFRRAVIGNLFAVIQSDDRLGRALPEHP